MASRVLLGFVIVLCAFAVTVGWSFLALRSATREAELLRSGYVPLQLRIGEALAEQNVFNAQLNHITAARNPADVREWIETARRARPITFALVREAAQALDGDDPALAPFRREVLDELAAIEELQSAAPASFGQMFQALAVGDRDNADRVRDDLLRNEAEGAARLRSIKSRIEGEMGRLTAAAEQREERASWLLLGLAMLTLLVGVATSIYARRVLAPLTAVTERAKAVAEGDLSPHPVVDDKSEIGELALTFENMVTAIQRARQELVQAERLTTIGKMAAHITHEIRNPLSSMGLNIELLEEELERSGGDKEQAQLVGAIKSEANRLSRIAEQYLSVARRPRPVLERESLEDLVRELLAFVRLELGKAKVEAVIDVEPGVPDIRIDESQLRQALLNLVRNAREAMPEGGTLRVGIARAVGGGVDLTVDDTGAGIPDDVRASIFDPFFTTKQRGTGLGLAVTRDIVEAHGGTIVCEPSPGGGTRFRIHLGEGKSDGQETGDGAEGAR